MTTMTATLEDGIYTDDASEHFSEASSEDRVFHWNSLSAEYVGISCRATGLPDNTMGKVGRHVVYLQQAHHSDLAAHPEGTDLFRRACEFKQAVDALKSKRRDGRMDSGLEALEAEIEAAAPLSPELAALIARYSSADAAWEAEDEQAWAVLRQAGY